MIRKIFISFFCLFTLSLKASGETIKFDENKSKINYTLTCFGFPFKKKFVPVHGQIYLTKSDSSRKRDNNLYLLNELDLTANFISTNILFRNFINYNKYPSFTFHSTLEESLPLVNKQYIEIPGNLSFHGITRKIKIKLKSKFNNDSEPLSLIGFFSIKMTDYGLVRPKVVIIPLDNVIKTKIELVF